MNFVGNTNLFQFVCAHRQWRLVLGTRNHFSFYRIYGLTLSPGEKWYSLSNQLVGRNVSQFVEGIKVLSALSKRDLSPSSRYFFAGK